MNRPTFYYTIHGGGPTLREAIATYLRYYGYGDQFQIVGEAVNENGDHLVTVMSGVRTLVVLVWGD